MFICIYKIVSYDRCLDSSRELRNLQTSNVYVEFLGIAPVGHYKHVVHVCYLVPNPFYTKIAAVKPEYTHQIPRAFRDRYLLSLTNNYHLFSSSFCRAHYQLTAPQNIIWVFNPL